MRCIVDVIDRGIGIEPKEMDRVFDKFYTSRRRMDSSNPGGLGLGLALAREIVRDHGGEIRVTSEVGRGSTFSFELPVAAPAPAITPEAAAAAPIQPADVRAGART